MCESESAIMLGQCAECCLCWDTVQVACSHLRWRIAAFGWQTCQEWQYTRMCWHLVSVSAGMLGCGMAASFQQLLAWRWVTGLGSALQMCGSQLCLADLSRADNRARCLGANQVT